MTGWLRGWRVRRVLRVLPFLVPPVLLAGAAVAIREHFDLEVPARLGESARVAVMAPLRAALGGGGPEGSSAGISPDPALAKSPRGPVVVSVWSHGHRLLRVEGRGATLGAAVTDAASHLTASPVLKALDPPIRAEARLQVDVVVAHAPLAENELLRAFGLVPGMDGLGVEVLGREVLLGADELVLDRLLMGARPFHFMEFSAGLDFARADALLAARASLGPGVYGSNPRRYFRFRADSFVEAPAAGHEHGRGRAPLPLVRGLPPRPDVTRESLRTGAIEGARYLVNHLTPNGRFIYELDLGSGDGSNPADFGDYSLPRHAGSTNFLAQVYGETHLEWLREPLGQAIETLVDLALQGGCKGTTEAGKPFACVVDRGASTSSLGSTALAVVALAEYRAVTGDGRHDETHRAMVEFLLDQQKPDGSFVHLYRVRDHRKDLKTRLLYFDGEACLALVKSYKIFQDPRMLAAAERGLDNLVGFYDFFAGQFFFGEEHWTCIAAEAAWPLLTHDRYRDFCTDYAAFLRDGQFQPDETPGQEDLVGAYGVTPFFAPYNTPCGSRTEAMISAYLLGRHHGKPDERIRQQNLAAVGYLLGQQLREDGAFYSPATAPLGAISASAIDKKVRIDFLQHAGSAMLRAAPLADR